MLNLICVQFCQPHILIAATFYSITTLMFTNISFLLKHWLYVNFHLFDKQNIFWRLPKCWEGT
jgi:hypothetical protein